MQPPTNILSFQNLSVIIPAAAVGASLLTLAVSELIIPRITKSRARSLSFDIERTAIANKSDTSILTLKLINNSTTVIRVSSILLSLKAIGDKDMILSTGMPIGILQDDWINIQDPGSPSKNYHFTDRCFCRQICTKTSSIYGKDTITVAVLIKHPDSNAIQVGLQLIAKHKKTPKRWTTTRIFSVLQRSSRHE